MAIGKIYNDNTGTHVVVLEEKERTPEGFYAPIQMYRVRHLDSDRETWFSRLLFLSRFKPTEV